MRPSLESALVASGTHAMRRARARSAREMTPRARNDLFVLAAVVSIGIFAAGVRPYDDGRGRGSEDARARWWRPTGG